MYADEYSRFSGGGNQFSNMLKMSAAPPGLKPFPVKMPTLPKRKKSNFSMPKMPGINIGLLLNLAIVGGIGLVGYKLYNKFFGGADSILSNTNDKGSQALAKTFVSTNQSKADTLKSTAASLNTKGLSVSSLHQSLANTFHDYLDSMWVDHDKIVKTILGENVQTFRLVSVAYGTRDLKNYVNSPAHILNLNNWDITKFMSADNSVGTLKDHLNLVLTSGELKQLSQYLAVI
jgi:hypothetical protein